MVTPRQHEAVFPVVEVQALFGEGVTPFPTENAETETTEKSEVKAQATADGFLVTCHHVCMHSFSYVVASACGRDLGGWVACLLKCHESVVTK